MIKRWILAFVVVSFSSCALNNVVHAQDNKKELSNKENKNKRAKKDSEKKDDVTYLDMSKDDGVKEDDMPIITKKGPL